MKKIAIIAVAVFLAAGGMLISSQTLSAIDLQAHGGYHHNNNNNNNSNGGGYYHG